MQDALLFIYLLILAEKGRGRGGVASITEERASVTATAALPLL